MFRQSQQVPVAGAVKGTVNGDIVIPGKATQCQLQADTNTIRYTMDGTPPTATYGLMLIVGQPPQQFLIEDMLNFQFIGDGGLAANLNISFFAGRNI